MARHSLKITCNDEILFTSCRTSRWGGSPRARFTVAAITSKPFQTGGGLFHKSRVKMEPSNPFSSSSWRILAADDDESSRELSRLILSRAGYSLDTVNDGESAWQALLSNHYDLL